MRKCSLQCKYLFLQEKGIFFLSKEFIMNLNLKIKKIIQKNCCKKVKEFISCFV